MKLFKKSILALLAVAVSAGFTACSDDDDYAPGQQSPGAYFSVDAPSVVQVPSADLSFSVDVYRTSTDAPASYPVTLTDPSGLFEVPATISFDGASLVTALPVTIKAPGLEQGQNYPITITLGDASLYGVSKYEVTVKAKSDIVTQKVGVGVYYYDGCYSGAQGNCPVTASYDANEPNRVTWEIGGAVGSDDSWGGGNNLFIEFEDFSDVQDGKIYCRIPDQYVTEYSQGGSIYVTDYAAYLNANGENGTPYLKDCYYEPETGLLTLHPVYYLPGTTNWFGGDNAEYLQLDGFPDYSVLVEYGGMYVSPEQNIQLIGKFETTSDPSKVLAACMQTDNPNTVLAAILAEGEDIHSLEAGQSVTELFPSQGPGNYIMMAVTYDTDGEPAELNYVSFVVTGAIEDPNLGWSDLGSADMADGWVMAGFSRGGVPIVVADEMFPVEVQYKDDDATLFRLVEPYGADYPIAANNAYPAKRNIQFVIDQSCGYVGIEEQPCGFGAQSWKGEMTIGNYEGYLRTNNPEVSNAAIVNAVKSKYPEDLSTYEEGVVTVPAPWFGAPGIGDGSFGYTWNKVQASLLYMPETPANVKALSKAKRVAAPKYVGVREHIKAKLAEGRTLKFRLPFQVNLNDEQTRLNR